MPDDAFSPAQTAQIEAAARRGAEAALSDAGLRIDEADHVDEARADFRFVRRLRRGSEGVASKIGMAVILAILGGLGWLLMQGLNIWKGQ